MSGEEEEEEDDKEEEGSNDEPSSEEESDDEPSSDEEEDDDDHMPPPPPPKNTAVPSAALVVTHVRHYSEEFKNHYYTQVDDPDGESDWVPPSTGIVQCTDDDASAGGDTPGRIFYTQSSTGKTAWDLNGF